MPIVQELLSYGKRVCPPKKCPNTNVTHCRIYATHTFKVGNLVSYNTTTKKWELAGTIAQFMVVNICSIDGDWFEIANTGIWDIDDLTKYGEVFNYGDGTTTATQGTQYVGFLVDGLIHLHLAKDEGELVSLKLSDLIDVKVADIEDKQGIVYDSATGHWIPKTIPTIDEIKLDDLSDVTISSDGLLNGYGILYDSAAQEWKNSPLKLSTLKDLKLSSTFKNKDIISYDSDIGYWTNKAIDLSLENLSNVDIDTDDLSSYKVLTYIGSTWTASKLSLENLDNVLFKKLKNKQVIQYSNGIWYNQTLDLSLDELSTVSIGTPTDKDVLIYDSTEGYWTNKSLNVTNKIEDLLDVTTSSIYEKQALLYNGEKWENQYIKTTTLDDFEYSGTLSDGLFFVYDSSLEKWTARAVSVSTTLYELTDTNINKKIQSYGNTLDDGDILLYNSSKEKWINAPISTYFSKIKTYDIQEAKTDYDVCNFIIDNKKGFIDALVTAGNGCSISFIENSTNTIYSYSFDSTQYKHFSIKVIPSSNSYAIISGDSYTLVQLDSNACNITIRVTTTEDSKLTIQRLEYV